MENNIKYFLFDVLANERSPVVLCRGKLRTEVPASLDDARRWRENAMIPILILPSYESPSQYFRDNGLFVKIKEVSLNQYRTTRFRDNIIIKTYQQVVKSCSDDVLGYLRYVLRRR
ncbi:MAG: hypothetical protein QXP53_03075 [Candidatus Pacearchaeota archaeon]